MRILKYSLVSSIFLLAIGQTGFASAATTVGLGSTSNFSVLAGSAITNVPTSAIAGDVGLSPAAGTSYTGLTAAQVTGTIYAVDAAGPTGSTNNAALLTTAKNDLVTAYNDAAGQTPNSTVASELGGTTKTAGIYNSADGTFGITGTLTLDAQGNANAVFIFKTASTLITAGSSAVVLANGAQACNVFWQVGSSATLGTNSTLKGTILALTSATLTTGAKVEGRVLARNGAVTLDSNTFTKATCAAASTTPAAASSTASSTSSTAATGAASTTTSGTAASTKLPGAGLAPSTNETPWAALATALVLVVTLGSLSTFLRKSAR